MTRMTPLDDHDAPDQDLYEETPPRSIFAATWFRALLVLIVLGVIGAVAVPYILDAMNPPAPKPTIASRAPASPPAATSAPSSATSTSPLPPSNVAPAIADKAPAAPVEKAPSDKTAKSDKADRSDKVGDKPADKTEKADKTDKTDKKDAMVASATTSDSKPESKPIATARPATKTTTKPAATTKSDPAKTEETTAPAVAAKTTPAPTKRVATKATPPSAPKATDSGDWWVQVGAFRDADTAKKVAAKLREQNYKVDESLTAAAAAKTPKSTASAPQTASDKPASAAPAGSDQYDVFVSGGTAADLNKRLSGKGLAAEASGAGVVVKPSLPLRDAVALSKDLAIDGFKVQVRRAGGAPEPAPVRAAAPETPSASAAGESLHRVRVGGYPDRAAAMVALKELEGKGYKPFLTRR
jgi:cell division protein FtsN